ncbi:hypothetical protein CKAH01_14750 [Colletotrichum kahawae]|uniref:Uncharacterized protein n=1 Tax=Colletotrichum kahawae TaxID=34407 RepID=A0AAD9YLH6_COLKA|nr:hypothetical protein CKAH01_14750 [Colletotrichum kahawae]
MMASVGLPPPSSAEQQARDLGMPGSVYPYRSATKHPGIGAPATAGPNTPDATTLPNAQPTSVRPAELHGTSQHPRYVRIAIEGDVEAYLATVQPRAPPSTVAASKVDGSISIYVLRPLQLVPGRTLKGTRTIGLDAAAPSGASLGFTRPLLTMVGHHSAHRRTIPWLTPMTIYSSPTWITTTPRHNLTLGLAGRIKDHGCLSKTDRAVSSRLMNLFNDLDSRGQIPMSQSVRTVLLPEEAMRDLMGRKVRSSMTF